MPLELMGIGTAVPQSAMDQSSAADWTCATSGMGRHSPQALRRLYRRTGVRKRHLVVLDETPSAGVIPRVPFFETETATGPTTEVRMQRFESEAAPLAVAAVRAALAAAKIDASTVTHLVTASCSGFYSPGFDISLIEELPLRPHVCRTHVGFMGCHAAINGLRIAQGFVDSDPRSVVLLCCLELCSLHYQNGAEHDSVLPNALFADGAAAVVGRHIAQLASSRWSLTATGSTLIPQTRDLMQWRIRDCGFEMTLSPRLPEAVYRHLRPWLEEWLLSVGSSLSEIASFAVHPGGPRILSACAEALDLVPDRLESSRAILARFGNMSSPTVLFILEHLRQANHPSPVLLLAFGPGLTIEAGLIR